MVAGMDKIMNNVRR